MTPENLREKLQNRRKKAVGSEWKDCSVLILLIERADGPHVLFELRTDKIDQPGDICLPGGRIEKGESFTDAALRETAEEIGISAEAIEILGEFDTLYTVGIMAIHTVVGVCAEESLKKIRLSEDEVAEVFTVPLSFFKDTKPMVHMCPVKKITDDFPFEESGIRSNYVWRSGKVPTYIYHYTDSLGTKRIIWGITAKIINWFIQETGY